MIYKEYKKLTWQGPAKVTAVDGVKIRIVHDGYAKTIHKSKVMDDYRQQFLPVEFVKLTR